MAIVADFTVSSRVGDSFNTVTFADASTGVITSRKWILGDGEVVEGNETTVKHTYLAAGRYDVTLVVQDSTDQDTETKAGYIIVNDIRPAPDFIIMQSFERSSGSYWRFYIDTAFHLVFETHQYIYRSNDRVIDIRQWALVQFDFLSETMYWGSYLGHYKEIGSHKSVNASPLVLSRSGTDIAPDSTVKLDELKIWSVEKNLSEYHSATRGRAGYLDLR
jgi:PKD repeat protein